jgi:hypothetical protein
LTSEPQLTGECVAIASECLDRSIELDPRIAAAHQDFVVHGLENRALILRAQGTRVESAGRHHAIDRERLCHSEGLHAARVHFDLVLSEGEPKVVRDSSQQAGFEREDVDSRVHTWLSTPL